MSRWLPFNSGMSSMPDRRLHKTPWIGAAAVKQAIDRTIMHTLAAAT